MRKAMAEPSEQGLKPGAEQRRQTACQSKAEEPEQPAEVVCHQEAGEPGIGPHPLLVHGSLDIDRREDGSTDPEDQQAGGCQGGGQAASDEFSQRRREPAAWTAEGGKGASSSSRVSVDTPKSRLSRTTCSVSGVAAPVSLS